ncbi:MAG: site-2 protease family protein [Thermoplasmataceae archaeon]
MISGLEIAVILIFAWIVILISLRERILKTKHFSLLGPALMIKTTKNRGVLDGISKRFPAIVFGKLSVILSLLTLIFAMFLIVYETILVSSVRITTAPPLSYYIALPGINPAIPVVYGGIALFVSVVVHEIMHGVVARKQKMKVNSVGALFFVAPLGAFVEPDEQEMSNADPVVRRRIVAAGPGVNIVIALITIFLLLFVMMPSVHPVSSGMYVEQVSPMPLVNNTNILPGSLITSFGNYSGDSVNSLSTASTLRPGTTYNATYVYEGKTVDTKLVAGVNIVSTIQGFPANNFSSELSGSVIISVNNGIVTNENELTGILDNITPGSTLSLTVLYHNETTQSNQQKTFSITTVSKYSYYQQFDPSANNVAYRTQSFIGVESSYLGLEGVPVNSVISEVFGGTMLTGGFEGVIYAIALPFLGLSPVPAYLQSLTVTPFMPAVFWGVVNLLYWFFWINFLLGLSNILPISVFDGSQFLRDTLYIWGRRKRLSFLKNEKTVRMIINTIGLIIVMILIYEIVLPYIA